MPRIIRRVRDLIIEPVSQHEAGPLEMLISILLYADDIVLLANSPEDLQSLLDLTFKWCEKWRLSVNGEKTEIMHTRTRNKPRSHFSWCQLWYS